MDLFKPISNPRLEKEVIGNYALVLGGKKLTIKKHANIESIMRFQNVHHILGHIDESTALKARV